MIDFHVTKHLHTAQGTILLDLSLQIQSGECVALYGSSGVGKTTLLRMLAGLEKPDSGYIHFNHNVWYDSGTFVKPQHRSIGFVFQDYALFPSMSIREQLKFALPRSGDQQMVDELLELTQLSTLANRYPAQLSGGQQQRVALARAVARQPEVLLLDEPLSALDQDNRLRLQEEIEKIQRRFNLTVVLVSHDAGEIKRLTNRVVMIGEGKILNQGSPQELLTPGPELKLGTVIAIESSGNQWLATVQIEEKIRQMRVAEASIQIGDRIWMENQDRFL